MANALITPSIIANEALFQLENNCIMGSLVHREYKEEFKKVGDTISIRKPVRFYEADGATLDLQDVKESSTDLTLSYRKHVAWPFSSQELTLTIQEYSERYIKPALIALINGIDRAICVAGAQGFYNRVGTPGTAPAGFDDLSAAALRMDDEGVPDDGMRYFVANPKGRWALANGLAGAGTSGVFDPSIVGPMIRRGYLGNIANFETFGDQNIANHLTGTYSGTPLVNDASFDNNTNVVTYDGMTGSVSNVLRVGDVFTIDDVYAVNPINKQSTGVLRQFVVLAASNSTSGAGTVTVYPTLIDDSDDEWKAYQTVDALPANDAGINIVGTASATYTQNLAFHKNAVALVNVPLELPDSVSFKARANYRGYSIRVIKDYDITNDREIIRLDVLYGVKVIYPELGVRVEG